MDSNIIESCFQNFVNVNSTKLQLSGMNDEMSSKISIVFVMLSFERLSLNEKYLMINF